MRLTHRQRLGAQYLAMGLTGAATAKELGLHPNTVTVWRGLPEFQSEVNRRQQEILHETRARLLNASLAAVDALQAIAQRTDDIPSALGAAKSLLSHAKIVPIGAVGGMQDCTGPTTPDLPRLEAEAVQLLECWRNNLDPEDEFIDWLHSEGMLCTEAVDELIADPDYLRATLTQYQIGTVRRIGSHDHETG
jgi:hypothetical protein